MEAAEQGVLAFDVGGTRIKAGIVVGGKIIALRTIDSPEDGHIPVIESLLALAEHFLSGQQEHAIQAIGISTRGIVDPQMGGSLDIYGPLAELSGVALVPLLQERLHLPTYIENDARMYALGELVYGAGRGQQNMLCLTLGTGVGSSVAINGRILRGGRGILGILGGHITIDQHGPLCTCGNIGCLEALIGREHLSAVAQAKAAENPTSLLAQTDCTPRAIFAAAAQGDTAAGEIVQDFTRALAAGVVSLVNVYGPDLVVIGGGLAHSAHQFLPAVQAETDRRAWTVPRGHVRIVPAELGDAAALIGVAELAQHPELLM